MIKKLVKYKDRPTYPNIVDPYEKELKVGFGKMLVKTGKEFGNKLNEILK